MKLSKTERLILANQFQLLSMKENDYMSKKDMRNYTSILLEGYEFLYEDVFNIVSNDTVNPEKSRFVINVLKMYRDISDSYYKLLTDNTNIDLKEKDIAFKGFDGNEETKEYIFLDFLINHYDRFEELKENEHMRINSHMNTISTYQSELKKYNEILDSKDNNIRSKIYLTENEIRTILNIKD